MKNARLRLAIVLCVLQPGCSFFWLRSEEPGRGPHRRPGRVPAALPLSIDMAEDAWEQTVRKTRRSADSYHYGRGFREGYADLS